MVQLIGAELDVGEGVNIIELANKFELFWTSLRGIKQTNQKHKGKLPEEGTPLQKW